MITKRCANANVNAFSDLGVCDLIDDARRSEVEDAGGAADGGDDGVIVKEINLEETEA